MFSKFFPPVEAGECYELNEGEWKHMEDKDFPTATILKRDMIKVIDQHVDRVVRDIGGINGFVLSSLSLSELAKVRAFVMSFPPLPIPWMVAEKVSNSEVTHNAVKSLAKGDDKSVVINGDHAKVIVAEAKDKATIKVTQA